MEVLKTYSNNEFLISSVRDIAEHIPANFDGMAWVKLSYTGENHWLEVQIESLTAIGGDARADVKKIIKVTPSIRRTKSKQPRNARVVRRELIKGEKI